MRGLVAVLALASNSLFAQIKINQAQYSDEAKVAGLEGTVLVAATAGENGAVRDLKIERSLGLGLDEQAIQAVAQQNLNPDAAGNDLSFAVDFTLPEKQSRWHLVGVEFKPPEGVSRPTFASAFYPVGPGIGVAAYDEGRLMGAIGRAASVTLSFEIDASGYPGNFEVVNASARVWGPQAAELVQAWRFHPGNRGGIPVAVPCTVKLLWGPVDFESSAITRQIEWLNSPPKAPLENAAQPAPVRARFKGANPSAFGPAPEYPDLARQMGLEGTVSIDAAFGPDGHVIGMKVLGSPSPLLAQPSMEAIKNWVVPPAMLNGQPVQQAGTVEFDFKSGGVTAAFQLQLQ